MLENKQNDKAILVGSYLSSQDKKECFENLQELKSLAQTFGLQTIHSMACHLRQISAATYIGKGKVEELLVLAQKENISTFIFDDELSPHQQRNLEKMLKHSVIDRTELILGVFAKRARTKEAKTQVKLAQYKYEMPRLKRLWTHLSRQKIGGGSGGYLKGEGERQIEIDKRLIKNKIAYLQSKLDEVKKHRETQRRQRQRHFFPTFAIVGYTNVGKSTLLNTLTNSKVLVEDKLFATLDTTTRKFVMDNHQEVLLVDTVGFIRKLPHTLVASFRSTLEELGFADILLHLVDVSHPNAEKQAESALQVIKELDLGNRPIITVLNKTDLVTDHRKIFKFKITYPFTVEMSVLKKIGVQKLLELMAKQIAALRTTIKLKIPQSQYELASLLMQKGRVISKEYQDNDILFEAEIPAALESKFLDFKV